MWEVKLRMRTAKTGGFPVKFVPLPPGSKCESDCFRDPEGNVWRGKAMPSSASISNEALRMRTLHEAADAYGKAIRKAIDPFLADR